MVSRRRWLGTSNNRLVALSPLCCIVVLLILPLTAVSSPTGTEFDWTIEDDARTEPTLLVMTSTTSTTSTTARPARHQIVSCPTDCVCKNSETVDCRGSGIRNVTSNFLANQRVTKLWVDIFGYFIKQLHLFFFAQEWKMAGQIYAIQAELHIDYLERKRDGRKTKSMYCFSYMEIRNGMKDMTARVAS